jgi:hypothetical protein
MQMQLLPPPVKVVAVCTMHLIKQCSVYCCHAGQPAAHCFVSNSSDCRCHSLRRVQFTSILGGVHVCMFCVVVHQFGAERLRRS